MMKKLILTVVIFLISVALIGGKPQQASAKAKWKLKFHHHMTAPDAYGSPQFILPYGELFEKASNGQIKVEHYWSSALGKDTDAYDFTAGGVADIAWVMTGYTPGRFPITETVTLPFLDLKSAEDGSKILWKMTEKFPELFEKEYAGVKLIALHTMDPYFLGMVDKPVKKLEDIKGKKIRTTGGPPEMMMKALGGTPVVLPFTEVYMALEKKVIDGATYNWLGWWSGKFYEHIDSYTMLNYSTGSFYMIMNMDTWKKFPPDLQKSIMETAGGINGSAFCGRAWDQMGVECRQFVEKSGRPKEIYQLPPDEVKKWRDLAQPVWDSYVKRLDSKGLPGKQIFDEMMKLVKEYQ